MGRTTLTTVALLIAGPAVVLVGLQRLTFGAGEPSGRGCGEVVHHAGGVSPRGENAFKVELGQRTLVRALMQAAEMEV